MVRKRYEIVYAAGVQIDPRTLVTLAVLHDKIYVPYPYDLDEASIQLMRWPGKYLDDLGLYQRGYAKWRERWKPLFDARLLEILPPATDREDALLSDRLLEKLGATRGHFSSSMTFNGDVAMAMHALFADTKVPELLLSKRGDTSTEHLRNVLASSLLRFQIPLLHEMGPDELLRARERVADERDGFIAYLNQQVDDTESRLAATQGDTYEAALRTVQRKIEPELVEHVAERRNKEAGAWARAVATVAKAVGTAFSIVTAPWNPKHYLDASTLLADGASGLAKASVEDARNKHRAFKFLAGLEEQGESKKAE